MQPVCAGACTACHAGAYGMSSVLWALHAPVTQRHVMLCCCPPRVALSIHWVCLAVAAAAGTEHLFIATVPVSSCWWVGAYVGA